MAQNLKKVCLFVVGAAEGSSMKGSEQLNGDGKGEPSPSSALPNQGIVPVTRAQ